jgi:type IX secretion system substrate protein
MKYPFLNSIDQSLNNTQINFQYAEVPTTKLRKLIWKINLTLTIITFFTVTNYSQQGWHLLGLENEEITAIEIDWSDQNIIYAGSMSDFSSGAFGGLFKSTNNGSSWDTLMRGVIVRDMDIHPTNARILYATILTDSAGIVKTTDAGENWRKADYGIQLPMFGSLGVLEIDPKHPDTLFAGTAGMSLGYPYKSIDGGENWSRIDPDTMWIWMPTLCGDSIFVNGYPLRSGIVGIGIDPVNTNIIYAGTNYTGNLFKSTDGGVSWIAACLQAGLPTTIEFSKNTSTIYVGTSWSDDFPVGIFKTTDGALTWSNPKSGLPDTLNVEKVQVFNEDDNELVVLAGNWRDSGGVWKYKDSWEFIGIDGSRVQTISLSGSKLYAGSRGVYVMDIITSVSEDDFLFPKNVYLYDNYPNPFNPTTKIKFTVPVGNENVRSLLKIYDILGNEVATLVDEQKSQGTYEVDWNADSYSSGVYFYSLQSGNVKINKKMLLLK